VPGSVLFLALRRGDMTMPHYLDYEAHYLDYEARRDMIVTRAWEAWTKNGLNLDIDEQRETTKSVQEAVNNTYVDDITDEQWLAATLARLTGR
jgi:hypothetical protein